MTHEEKLLQMEISFNELNIDEQIIRWNKFWADSPYNDDLYIYHWFSEQDQALTIQTIGEYYELTYYGIYSMCIAVDYDDYFVTYNLKNNTLCGHKNFKEFGEYYDMFIDGLVKESEDDE